MWSVTHKDSMLPNGTHLSNHCTQRRVAIFVQTLLTLGHTVTFEIRRLARFVRLLSVLQNKSQVTGRYHPAFKRSSV